MKKALTLCGGGSLGAYEIGAAGYLHETKAEFDIYTGTSIGATNAVLLSSLPYDRVAELWSEVTLNKVIKNGFLPGAPSKEEWRSKWPKMGSFILSFLHRKFADMSPFADWLKEAIDPEAVVRGPKSVGIVTTSMPVLKEVDIVLNEVQPEDVIPYILASSAAYPIFPAYEYKGKRYIDGGYTNNLPIDLAFALGADEVIAIMLRAIPEVPQHIELLRLPNVKAVIPTHDTGPIFDFSPKTLRENTILGYLDCAKRFGKYWGHAYAFEKDGNIYRHAERFMTYLARETLEEYFAYEEICRFKPYPINRPLDLFLRPMEIVAANLKIDYLRPYAIKEFINILKKTIHTDYYMKKAEAFGKRKSFALGLKDDEVATFLAYAIRVIEHHESDLPLKKTSRVDPLAGVLYWLSRYLHQNGLV